MAEVLNINRDELAKFLPNHEAIIQFENLFKSVQTIVNDDDGQDIVSESALAKANSALVQLKDKLGNSFEAVNKNLKDWTKALSYTGLKLNSETFTKGGKTITKTYNYTSNLLTSVVLSGDTPARIDLTKSLTYSGLNLTGVAYS